MIAYFPKIYEDELLYSVFARFHIHSGYLFFEYTKNALFENKETTPIIEFINKLKPDIVEVLTKNMTMEEVVLEHTMFPFYARFYNSKKKKEGLKSLVNMESDFSKSLSKKFRGRCLKYCPLCAKEDRERIGEAIWYRKHQIIGVTVCPIHKCKLYDSKVIISRDIRIPYITAEQEISEGEIEKGTDLEIRLSEYLSKLINPEMYNNGNVAGFIESKRETGNLDLFFNDFCSFYEKSGYTFYSNAIRKVLNGNNDNPFLIGLVAFYLDIPVNELIGSYKGVCKLERKKRVLIDKPKCRNYWKDKDNDFLGLLDGAIRGLEGNKETKPERICVSGIERGLGLPKGSLRSMDKCMDYINNKCEDMETYHARLVIWAIHKLNREGKQITWAQINVAVNIMYVYRETSLNKALEIAEEEDKIIIENIIKGIEK